ncbi:MAG: MBL fold metallo-hydrolase [Candidatus Binataceae bacterium]
MAGENRAATLADSIEMEPIQGTVEVNVPAPVLWEAFIHANLWPRWNKCFFWVHNRSLVLGQYLIWAFQPIRWWYLYRMFAVAKIAELEPNRRVTWEVTALPGFYARHTYHVEDLGSGRARFGSWEQAMGAQIRFSLTRRFWIAHFTFVKDRSLEGARQLEAIYVRDGKIGEDALAPKHRLAYAILAALVVLVLLVGVAGLWFYTTYVRLSEVRLAPGVYAVMGGGGNSLIVSDGGRLLLVDTKFPPASNSLKHLIKRQFDAPVNFIVNTHYHYDHTQGNIDYPGAAIYAYRAVPGLMRRYDGDWWSKHQNGIPTHLVDNPTTIAVGSQEVLLAYPGNAHTHGDLYVYLRRGDKEIVATGDLVFNGYYPMMDMVDGGVDLPGLIKAVRMLAAKYPGATFVPGHGDLASAADLSRFAGYLRALADGVARARQRGFSEDQAVEAIDLSSWPLRMLPSYHDGEWCWSTAAHDVRWAYQLESGTRVPSEDCPF